MNAISFDAINIFKDNIENMFLQLSDVIILHLSRKYMFDADEASKFIKDSFNIDNIKDDDIDIHHDITEKNLQDIARDIADNKADDIAVKKADDIAEKKTDNITENNADDIVENNAEDIVENNADDIVENNADDIAEKKADDIAEKKADDIAEKKADDISEKKADDIAEKKTDDIEVNKNKKNKKNKKNNKPNVLLPFCNKVFDDFCHAIRLNHGLYTQCTNPIKKDNLCTTCHKQTLKNDNNLPNYGLINERIDNPNWKFNGKSPVKYADILTKLNINIQDAINESVVFGIVIPEEQLTPSTKNKKKPGRPKKSSVSINDDNSSTKTKKKPGRPKIIKKIVSTADDIISNKLTDLNSDDIQNVIKSTEQNSLDVIESKSIHDDDDDDDDDNDNNHDHNNDMKVININDIEYLKDPDNNIYIANTHELIGKWNSISNSIDYFNNLSKENSSDYENDDDNKNLVNSDSDNNSNYDIQSQDSNLNCASIDNTDVDYSVCTDNNDYNNTEIFLFNGVKYLKDNDNYLYLPNSSDNLHKRIGKWYHSSNSIHYVNDD